MNIVPFRLRTRAGISRWFVLGIAGWLLAIPAAWFILPRIHQRLLTHIPAFQEASWKQIVGSKKKQFATPWKDSRPLCILAGDSQIEHGSWYELGSGAFAVRNCGLSMARIEDVVELIDSIRDRNVHTVVLMCGINNIGYDEPVDLCANKYATLLDATRKKLRPQQVVVVSIMPIRESVIDERSRATNRRVMALNQMLVDMCHREGAIFADIHRSVAKPEGGLLEEYTIDGLHLNEAGYAKIAPVIFQFLPMHQ